MKPGERFNPKGLFTGAFIPNCVLKNPELTMATKLVWAKLVQYLGGREVCWPSQEMLAEDLCLTTRTVRRSLNNLEKRGFIVVIRPEGKERLLHYRSKYAFLWHKSYEAAVSIEPENGFVIESDSGDSFQGEPASGPPWDSHA